MKNKSDGKKNDLKSYITDFQVIFSYLSVFDLVRLMAVSKRLNKNVKRYLSRTKTIFLDATDSQINHLIDFIVQRCFNLTSVDFGTNRWNDPNFLTLQKATDLLENYSAQIEHVEGLKLSVFSHMKEEFPQLKRVNIFANSDDIKNMTKFCQEIESVGLTLAERDPEYDSALAELLRKSKKIKKNCDCFV